MSVPDAQVWSVLHRFNPWWRGQAAVGLPSWQRAAFPELLSHLQGGGGRRALFLAGARQVGKTTLLRQATEALVGAGWPPGRLLYISFDHPVLKLVSPDHLLALWRQHQGVASGPAILLLDEVQAVKDWGSWVKHLVDFEPELRIAFTGSVMPLRTEATESGVGRWRTLRISPLSFYEFMKLRKDPSPDLEIPRNLSEVALWDRGRCARAAAAAEGLLGPFQQYLVRGGFPEAATLPDLPLAQRYLREDLVDRVLRRDLSTHFQIRRSQELEACFTYLCLQDGGLVDPATLASKLEVSKPTVLSFLEVLEAGHLIHRLPSLHQSGKASLRPRHKVYLVDPALASAILLSGDEVLEDPTRLGRAVESAVFRHLFGRHYAFTPHFSYWQNAKGQEVDFVMKHRNLCIPFEVKYQAGHVDRRKVAGLRQFLAEHASSRAYLITQDLHTLGPWPEADGQAILQVPASLWCWWTGAQELEQPQHLPNASHFP